MNYTRETDNSYDGMSKAQVPNTVNSSEKRTITIQPMDHGYVVAVGCKTFAIEDRNRMLTHIAAYLADPAAAEDAYYKGELHIGE